MSEKTIVKEEAHLEVDSSALGMEKADVAEQIREHFEKLGVDVEINIEEPEEDN